MKPWYRAYVGTCADAKIAEAAMVAGISRCVIIAVWHTILESASYEENAGLFSVTPRRAAATLCEPLATIEAAFAALAEVGMIEGQTVVAWRKRQFDSDAPGASTNRVQAYRSRRHGHRPGPPQPEAALPFDDAPGDETARNGDETLCNGGPSLQGPDVTTPETESEPERDSSSSSDPRAREPAPGGRPKTSLEMQARALMGTSPVVIDPDFGPIRRLVEEGLTEADVLSGLAAALEARDFRPRSWAKLENWVRRAAKDRLAQAADAARRRAGIGAGLGPNPRAGPGGATGKVVNLRMAALREIYAEEAARAAGGEHVQFA